MPSRTGFHLDCSATESTILSRLSSNSQDDGHICTSHTYMKTYSRMISLLSGDYMLLRSIIEDLFSPCTWGPRSTRKTKFSASLYPSRRSLFPS